MAGRVPQIPHVPGAGPPRQAAWRPDLLREGVRCFHHEKSTGERVDARVGADVKPIGRSCPVELDQPDRVRHFEFRRRDVRRAEEVVRPLPARHEGAGPRLAGVRTGDTERDRGACARPGEAGQDRAEQQPFRRPRRLGYVRDAAPAKRSDTPPTARTPNGVTKPRPSGFSDARRADPAVFPRGVRPTGGQSWKGRGTAFRPVSSQV